MSKDLEFTGSTFTVEAIVQVARSLRTKSLDTNQNLINLKGLPVEITTNTDLRPIKNNLQRINLGKSCRVNVYKGI